MSFSPVWESLKPLECLYGTNIDALRVVLEQTDDPERFKAELARFCVARPRLSALLKTEYFESKYAGDPVYDLVVAACAFGAGDLRTAEAACKRALVGAQTPFFHLMRVRIHGAGGDRQRESEAMAEAAAQWPDDTLVVLSQAELALAAGDASAANAALDRVRPAVEEHLKDEIAATALAQADLQEALDSGRLVRSGPADVYDDALTRATWLGYLERFTTQNRFQSGDGFLIDYLDGALTDFCRRNQVAAVLDFGSLCAEIIARPARKLPGVRFIGIDRQEFIATMNYEGYSLPNMAFESGDIMEYLPKFGAMPGRKVMFHARTTSLLYPALVQKIYAAAHAAGVDHVIGWEGDGLSRHSLKFYGFGEMPDISQARKSVLFNHNYRRMLEQSGYQVTHFDRPVFPTLVKDVADLVGSALFFVGSRKAQA